MNKRRKLVISLGAGALTVPLSVFAQREKTSFVVGVLRYSDRSTNFPYIEAFKEGLESFGYIEGKNLTLHIRYADGEAERLGPLAEELVRLKVDIIMAGDTPSTRAAQRATTVYPSSSAPLPIRSVTGSSPASRDPAGTRRASRTWRATLCRNAWSY